VRREDAQAASCGRRRPKFWRGWRTRWPERAGHAAGYPPAQEALPGVKAAAPPWQSVAGGRAEVEQQVLSDRFQLMHAAAVVASVCDVCHLGSRTTMNPKYTLRSANVCRLRSRHYDAQDVPMDDIHLLHWRNLSRNFSTKLVTKLCPVADAPGQRQVMQPLQLGHTGWTGGAQARAPDRVGPVSGRALRAGPPVPEQELPAAPAAPDGMGRIRHRC
jgi:hypothetical protein